MTTVTVERKSGASTTRVKVTAKSIRRAVELAGGRYARVVFPIDPQGFFADRTIPGDWSAEGVRTAAA